MDSLCDSSFLIGWINSNALLMQIRLLIIGNVKLWHITAVIIIVDLMQLRSEIWVVIFLIFQVLYLV